MAGGNRATPESGSMGGIDSKTGARSGLPLCTSVSPVVQVSRLPETTLRKRRATLPLIPIQALFRHLKIHAAIVIHFDCGRKIELSEWNFLRGTLIEHPERSAGDRVIPHFFHMLVAENQRRRWNNRTPFFLARLR